MTLIGVLFTWGWIAARAADPPANPSKAGPHEVQELNLRHLPNAVQVTPKVISGGQPDGDPGFAELERLGVKTVINVDGMKPDVAGAKQHGLRYVHLPHGYDGISVARVQALAKAVRDLPGPIYVHCHHGKHRSPAAATAACVTAGLLDPKLARSILEVAGTGRNYAGLFRVAQEARPLSDSELDAVEAEFPEVAELPPMAEAMVEIEHSFDRLKQVAGADWKTPANHPDLDPAHEALILREHFTELLRAESKRPHSGTFQELLRESELRSKELEMTLRAKRSSQSLSAAKSALGAIDVACAACHEVHRDAPDVRRNAD